MLMIFQVSMALLVSLSGLTAAIAEGVGVSAITLPVALATWFFVDFKRLVGLPGWLSPLLGLLAFAAAAIEYLTIPEPSYLAVGNHLLAYLTWILLCQQKQVRQYWTLCALSILQIAVTALLTYSIWFGIALVAYCLLATWTLSVFLLCRSSRSFHHLEADADGFIPVGTAQTDQVRIGAGISLDRHERLVTPRFCLHTGVDTAISLAIASLFFLFIPRIWPTAGLSKTAKGGTPLTGFTTEVRLGDMGEILESKEKVMDLHVFHAKSNGPLSSLQARTYLGSEPLFRGAALEEYRQGRWHRPQFKTSRNIIEGIPEATYRLRVDLAGLDTEAIFSFGNAVGVAPVKSVGVVAWDYFSNEMIRSEETDLSREFSYDLYTIPGSPDSWLSGQRQREFSEALMFEFSQRNFNPMRMRRYQQSLDALLQLPEELEPLLPITQRVTAGASSPEEAAQQIENWLTSSGEFRYTMNLSVSDSSIDPILDFLKNRRSGHCEYFASSMATMLRCVQIPSRVITGFKGAVFNEKTRTFTVYQYHAHAWVEAYLNGQWVTFDPTPSERDTQVEDLEGKPSKMLNAWRSAESSWHRFSTLSREGQNEKIYQPLVQRATAIKNIATDLLQGRKGGLKQIAQFLTTPERWLSLEGGIVVVLLILLNMAVYRLIRMLRQASQSLRGYLKSQADSAAARPPRVPFYEQLIAILRQQGLVQQPSQTAREFIHSALPGLLSRLSTGGMEAWPEDVVEKFYRVRFGRLPLTVAEIQELESRLQDLEKSLQSREEPQR